MKRPGKNVFNWRAPGAEESVKRVIEEASSPERAAATICAIMARAAEKGVRGARP